MKLVQRIKDNQYVVIMVVFVWQINIVVAMITKTLKAENNKRTNPYPSSSFVRKMLSAFYACCIYSSAFKTRFFHGSKL